MRVPFPRSSFFTVEQPDSKELSDKENVENLFNIAEADNSSANVRRFSMFIISLVSHPFMQNKQCFLATFFFFFRRR